MSFKVTASAIVCLTFVLAACAGGPPQGRPSEGGRRGPPPGGSGPPGGRPSLFISPPGEPFRTAPGLGDPRAAWLRLVDPAGSGVIAAEALVADARRYFAVLDRDHNGAIEGAEVSSYENTIVPEILAGGGGPGGGGLQGAARFGLLNDPQPIRSADFNLDYRVTLAEYERKARETFARLDANHDGVLRVSELPPPPSLNAPRQGGGRPGGAPRGGPGGGRGGPGGPGGGR
jgi:hypothetical protein